MLNCSAKNSQQQRKLVYFQHFLKLVIIMRRLYTIIFYLALPFLALFMCWKGRKDPNYAKGLKERYGFYHKEKKPTPQGILVHAASVGEVMLATSFIKALQKHYPHLAITLSTMTPTGAQQARQNFGASITHCYLPFDVPFAVRRFLAFIQPQVVVVIETEIWANLFTHLAKKNIPLIIANARLSARSTKGYLRFQKTMSKLFKSVTLVCAQDKISAERYMSLGVEEKKILITGNIKFDHNFVEKDENMEKLRRECAQRPVWVAGSTHAGEDEIILQAHKKLLQKFPQLLLILVPRHKERFALVAEEIKASGLSFVTRRSQEDFSQANVLLGDTMGELMRFYGVAQVVFVGGSFIARGGHNPLEPLAFKCPVISGEHVFNFAEIYQQLSQDGAVKIIPANKDSLATQVQTWLENPAKAQSVGAKGFEILQQNRGALAKLFTAIQPYLEKK